MSSPSHPLILFLPVILRILNTRSQFRIESRIRAGEPGCREERKKKSPAQISPCRARQGLQRERKRRKGKKRKERIERNEETIGDILAAEAPLQEIRQIARDIFRRRRVFPNSIFLSDCPSVDAECPTEKDNTRSEDPEIKRNGCRVQRCESERLRRIGVGQEKAEKREDWRVHRP